MRTRRGKRHNISDLLDLLSTRDLTEKQLRDRLVKIITLTIGTIVVVFISLTILGPKFGGLLGIISIHRNDKDEFAQLPPAAPTFADLPSASNSNIININGYAEPGTTIKLFVNGPEKATALTDKEGLFSFINIELSKGNNTIFAKAVNKEGKESENSQIVNISLDDKKPEIEISSPKDTSVVKNLDKRIVVTGKVTKPSTVRINDRLAILGSDLSFEILIGVEEGEVKIKVEAVDDAGNKAEKTLRLIYTP